MYSLFLDTHDRFIKEVLYQDGVVIDKNMRESSKNHSDYIMVMLKDLLDRNSVTVHDLSEILVCNGPGSFTGVRLAVTIAKTLAFTLDIPIKTCMSLDQIAISSKEDEKIAVIRDFKGAFYAFYKGNKIVDEPKYLNTKDFEDFLLNNKAIVLEDEPDNYDYDAIYEMFKSIKPTIAHNVNPLYIKVIEVLAND